MQDSLAPRKLLYSFDIDPEWKSCYVSIQERVGGRIKCNYSERDESTEERWQCMKQYIWILHGTAIAHGHA